MVGAEPAQGDDIGRRGEGGAEVLALDRAGVLGRLAKGVEDAAEATRVDGLAGDDRDGGDALQIDAADARAGDDDLVHCRGGFERGRFRLSGRGLGEGGGGRRQGDGGDRQSQQTLFHN
ncbi:hypothetical protein D3C80_1221410 [compost metagenome]